MLLCLLATAGIAVAGTHPFGVLDMLNMERISDPRVSPDGTRVVFTVRSTDMAANRGRNDLWLASVDGTGLRRLTTHEASDTSGRWAPDGKSIYFLSTRSGSSQVWRLDFAGGEPAAITTLPQDVDALEVSPDGKRLVFGMAVFPGKSPAESREKLDAEEKSPATGQLYDSLFVRHWDTWGDGTRNHLFAYDLATGTARDLMPKMDADCPTKPFGGSEDFTVSPDGRTVVFSAKDVGHSEAWSTNYDLFEVPADGSAPPKKLTTNPAWDAQPRFSPDGKTLAYLAMSRPGYEADRFRIVLRDVAAGTERSLDLRADSTPTGDRSPGEIVWTADGKQLILGADHLANHVIFVMDLSGGVARVVAGNGTLGSPQPAGAGRILFARNSFTSPNELFSIGLDGKDERPITRLNESRLASASLGQAELFKFPGAKGDTVYGWLVRPADFDPAKKYPMAFLIHGGPQGSWSNDFHYRWNPQAYAGAGYVAVMVDFHGSTGYGQAFTDAINGDWGGKPYDDLVKGFDYVVKSYPFVDGTRAAALGASYGGYMINWIAGQPFASKFRCLVVHDGNPDEEAAYYMTEELWFPEWEHGGPAFEKPAGYRKHNPIEYAKNWKTPTLVVHGGKDYRVVDTSGIATFNILQRKGVPSKFLYFPDESHWVLKPANSKLWHDTVLGWLEQWTKK
jgi:dipeptidyl aminopeptidase/acylaminoacyl peptidase